MLQNRILGSVTGLAMEHLFSELQLSEIDFSDQAEYQCIVRNHYGSAYSLKYVFKIFIQWAAEMSSFNSVELLPCFRAKLMVLQKPRIDYSPSNISIVRGGSAKLRCAAQGMVLPLQYFIFC